MTKNLVVCCDGTANEFARDHTNVLKLFSTFVQDPARQLAFYHPAVGTIEAVGALTSVARTATKLFGKAAGYGLEAEIRDAYASVVRFHEEGGRLFLFGFSRGAYAVRAVASLLPPPKTSGVLAAGGRPLPHRAPRATSLPGPGRGGSRCWRPRIAFRLRRARSLRAASSAAGGTQETPA